LLSAAEEEQFWALYLKTSETLYRKAFRMCRGHEADARDSQQATYLKALVHWDTFSSLTDPQRHAWLATTLMREVLQIWRAPHRSRETSSHGSTQEQSGPVADSDAVHEKGQFDRACRAIAILEGRQREVIALHCLAGYEIQEVAQMLGISTSTVRVHLHGGRQRLKAIMGGQEGTGRDHA
jgi:RNA polymerase sigma factor (sigma-70 family)